MSLARLAERERESFHAGAEKLDFELPIDDGIRLPDQLIETLFGHRAVALFVNVNAVGLARRLSIDQHTKLDGCFRCGRAHNQVKIAGVEAIDDAPTSLVQCGGILLHGPIAGQCPLIEPQPCRLFIGARLVQHRPAWRRKVLSALEADIVFWGSEIAPIGSNIETPRLY